MRTTTRERVDNLEISEMEIIDRINSGEKELYEVLLRRNNQKLYRVVRSYIQDLAEIEDVMQNTYLKAYEKLYQFKRTSQFSTWLIKIGINEALSDLREKAKTHHVNGHSNEPHLNSILEIPGDNQLNPESKIIREEAKQLLEYFVDSLDPKYRTVYIMKEVEEMSIHEISECLDLSSSNVKVRLHRAKKALKDKLSLSVLPHEIFEYGDRKCDLFRSRVMKQILKTW